MYTLTLTREERKAIDWVGNRYSNGYDLYRLLWVETDDSYITGELTTEQIESEGLQWDSDCDITFHVSESVARQIKDNAESEDIPWPCFAYHLTIKMQEFVDSIV